LRIVSNSDRIEKQIDIAAPVSRVWRALTDHREFGEWFCVKIDAPFVPGQMSHGSVTWPGYEHLKWEALIEKIEPQSYFSFKWHPYAVDPKQDYSAEPMTLVEFHLEKSAKGSLLKVVESGFDKIPAARRSIAFLKNGEGWGQQMINIEKYVAKKP
jgi:uncharacterized protein YndB with AHSA1/START domain